MSREPRLRIETRDRAIEIVGGRLVLRETGSRAGTYEVRCAEVRALLDEHRRTLTLWIETALGERAFSLVLKRGAEMDRARRIATRLGGAPRSAPPPHAPDIVGNDGGTRVLAGARRSDAPPTRPPSTATPRAAPPAAKPAPIRPKPATPPTAKPSLPPDRPKPAAPPTTKPEPAPDRPKPAAPPTTKPEPAPGRPEAEGEAPLAAESEPALRPAEPEPAPEPLPEPPAPPPFAGIELPLPDDGEDWIVFDPLPGTLRLLADPRD